jgi:hypothetical protein
VSLTSRSDFSCSTSGTTRAMQPLRGSRACSNTRSGAGPDHVLPHLHLLCSCPPRGYRLSSQSTSGQSVTWTLRPKMQGIRRQVSRPLKTSASVFVGNCAAPHHLPSRFHNESDKRTGLQRHKQTGNGAYIDSCRPSSRRSERCVAP